MERRRARAGCLRCTRGCYLCREGCISMCCCCCYEYGSDVEGTEGAEGLEHLVENNTRAEPKASPSRMNSLVSTTSVGSQATKPPSVIYQAPPYMPPPMVPPMQYPVAYQPPAPYPSPQYAMPPPYPQPASPMPYPMAPPPQYSAPQYAAPQYAAPQYTFAYFPPGAQPPGTNQQGVPSNAMTSTQTPTVSPPDPASNPDPGASTSAPAPIPLEPHFTVNPIINVAAPQTVSAPSPTPAAAPSEELPPPKAPPKKLEKLEELDGGEAERIEKPWKRLLDRPTPEIRTLYEFGTILGKGSTSIVRQVKDRGTGKEYACKSIAKDKMKKRQHIDDMKREIQVMHHLAGHPNVVDLHGVYEDRKSVHLVMDLCTGGELFDHILASGGYSEANAAAVMRTILSVVSHCHELGVIHRDIKPENFLWADASFKTLKAIDFGLSAFFKPGKFFKDLVGSKYYVAPEVLRRSYTQQADIWSCGVVLYMMLTGLPPFLGDTLHDVFDNILRGEIDYENSPWPELSAEAKKCTKMMLTHQSKKRATAPELLKHPWMVENGVASDKPVNSAVIRRLEGFSGMNRVQQIARKIIVRNLPMEEIEGLKHLFETLDADKNGTISSDELRTAITRQELSIPMEEFEQIVKAADVDGDGMVDYNEFLAATLNAANLAKEENLLRAFEHFDSDHSGYITRTELIEALKGYGEVDNLEMILEDVDKDQDGKIDYDEFKTMMLRNIGDF